MSAEASPDSDATDPTRASWAARFGAAALVLSIFNGTADGAFLGIPIGRIALVAFVVALAMELVRGRRVQVTILGLVLLAQAAWVAISAAASGTLTESLGFFGFVDEILMPAIMFLVAPVAFSSPADRALLIKAITVAMIGVSLITVAQSLGLTALLPGYLSTGVQSGIVQRGTGPSLQVAANGATLAMSAGVAIVLLRNSVGRWRIAAWLGLIGLSVGCFLTLTRSVWLAWIAAIITFAIFDARARKAVLAAAVPLVAAALAAAAFIPALGSAVDERLTTVRSLYDRTNTNAAAVKMLEENAVTGVGWRRFLPEVDNYVRQLDLAPLTSVHIPAHNVLLARGAELGLVGLALFVAALLLGPVRVLVLSAPTGDRQWRAIAAAAFAAWFCVAMSTPMGYTFPNYFLWLSTGLALTAARSTSIGGRSTSGTALPTAFQRRRLPSAG